VHRETKIAVANQLRRFGQKAGFGERRSSAKPLTMKIFLLPKTATQSPRSVLLPASISRDDIDSAPTLQ
jgi:hypothetical protein